MVSFLIVSDKKGINDYVGGMESRSSEWDAKPNYLLNKLLLTGNHEVIFIDHEKPDLETLIERELTEEITLIWHIDKTFMPPFVRELSEEYQRRGIKSINSQINDISKKRVERVCQNIGFPTTMLSRGSDYQGRVIVKSDFNSFESHLGYHLYNSLQEVSQKVFEDDQAVVQKFLQSAPVSANYFQMDRYIFVGEMVVFRTMYSNNPIIKGRTSLRQYSVPVADLSSFNLPLGTSLNKIGINLKEPTTEELKDLERVKQVKRLHENPVGFIFL